MSETKDILTSNTSFNFSSLTSNKYFWMGVFIIACISMAVYYYKNYMNKEDETKDTEQEKTEPKQLSKEDIEKNINQLIQAGVLVPDNKMQQPMQQYMQQPMQQPMQQSMQQPMQQPMQPTQTSEQISVNSIEPIPTNEATHSTLEQMVDVPTDIPESTGVASQELTQEELNMLKQQLDG